MDIHMNQHMGLTGKGKEYIKAHAEVIGERTVTESYYGYGNAIVANTPIYDEEVYEEWESIYDPIPLKQYIAKDGSVFREVVQASPWSSGPMIFLALQNENGEWIEETLWDEETINSMI